MCGFKPKKSRTSRCKNKKKTRCTEGAFYTQQLANKKSKAQKKILRVARRTPSIDEPMRNLIKAQPSGTCDFLFLLGIRIRVIQVRSPPLEKNIRLLFGECSFEKILPVARSPFLFFAGRLFLLDRLAHVLLGQKIHL